MGRPPVLNPRSQHAHPAFTVDEYRLLQEACQRARVPVRDMLRNLALHWVAEGLATRGGARGGVCGSTSGCRREPAVLFNKQGRFWMCQECGDSVNLRMGQIAVEEGPTPIVSFEEQGELLEKVNAKTPDEAPKSRAQLFGAIRKLNAEALKHLREIERLDSNKEGGSATLAPGFLSSLP